jgi:hypothetical protein
LRDQVYFAFATQNDSRDVLDGYNVLRVLPLGWNEMAVRKLRVRVVMMQRDEGETLARWLSHYGGLFRFDNLTILDNGSMDVDTILLLREAERAGAQVIWGLTSPSDFPNKGEHVRNVIMAWDKHSNYDFALPVDCDEILAVFTDAGLTANHDAIHAALRGLKDITSSLRIDLSLFNVPGQPGWFAPHRTFHKGFLPKRSIESIDEGFHNPVSRLAPHHAVTTLAYLHWHNKSFEYSVAWAKRKLIGLVDTGNIEALKAYAAEPGARGVHLVDILLMNEQQYTSRYEQEVQIYVPPDGTANLLRIAGGISVWDSKRYLARHPDVVSYGFPCLHHYLRFGYLEGRPLR